MALALVTSSVVTPLRPAFAASSSPTTDQNLQSWWYYYATSYCFSQVNAWGGSSGTAQIITSGNWFGDLSGAIGTGNAIGVGGYYMSDVLPGQGSDGNNGCNKNNSEIMQNALKLWGINGTTAACDSGVFTRANGANCVNGQGDFTESSNADSKWTSYLQKAFYNGKAPPLTNAMKYVIYEQTFLQGCASGSKSFSSASDVLGGSGQSINSSSSNNHAFEIAVLSGSGAAATMTKAYYSATKSGGDTVNTFPTTASSANGNTSESCSWLASQIADPAGTLALAYLAAVMADAAKPSVPGTGVTAATSSAPTCDPSIGMGWIVCVVAQFMANLVDGMYKLVVANLLAEPPINISDSHNGEVAVWQVFLSIANVLFVVFFLSIIYSHLANVAVDKYGLKRMLPRMILAAVLVNASLYICAAAVDISNVLGASILSLLQGIQSKSSIAPDAWSTVTSFLLAGAAATTTTAVATVGTVGLVLVATPELGLALLGIFLPLLLGALLAIFTVVFILIARHALLFMLVVLSPLAFVAYLLPNTQSWFTKWRQWFVSLLVLYPAVSFMFGACQIAGMLMIGSAVGGVLGAVGGAIAIMSGMFMMVAPFFFLPFMILRFGGANLDQLAGSVTNKLRGVTMPLANLGGRAGRRAMGHEFNRLQAGQGRGAGSFVGRTAQRWSQFTARRGLAGEHYEREQQHAVMERLGNDEAYRLAAAGGDAKAADLLEARAAFHADKMWDEEVGRQQKSLTSTRPRDLLAIVNDETVGAERRAAAAGMIMSRGSMSDIHSLFDASQQLGDNAAASGIRKQMMQDMNRTPFGLGSGDTAALKRGEAAHNYDRNGNPTGAPVSYAERLITRSESKLSDATWAGLDPDDQIALKRQALAGQLSPKALQNLVDSTADAEENPNVTVNNETKELGQRIREYARAHGVQPGTKSTAAPGGGTNVPRTVGPIGSEVIVPQTPPPAPRPATPASSAGSRTDEDGRSIIDEDGGDEWYQRINK